MEELLKDIRNIEERTHLYANTEKALKNLTNWTLGINIGLFTIIILKIQDILIKHDNPIFYKILVVIALISLAFSGFIKHRFLLRDKVLCVLNDNMRIEVFYKKNASKTDIDIDQVIDEKYKHLSEIRKLDKMIDVSIIVTFLTLILFVLFILIQL